MCKRPKCDFPDLVLKEIFGFLSVRDRLILKSTCKKWKFMLDTFSHQRKMCIYSTEYPYDERWCWSGELVADRDLLYLKFNRENTRRFDLKNAFFCNLQNLSLYRVGDKANKFLEEVHLLIKLKVLMVNVVGIIKLPKLSSASLEKFSLECHGISNCLTLDTPQLNSLNLASGTGSLVRVDFPQIVKHLQCKNTSFHSNSNLRSLKNLETLIWDGILFDFELNHFSSLSRLELFAKNEVQMNVARRIWEEGKRLGRDRLEMFVSGFRAELAFDRRDVWDLCIPFEPSATYLEYAARNCSDMVRIHSNIYFNVNTLVQCGNLIPRDFFDKFPKNSLDLLWRVLKLTESEQSKLTELIEWSKTRELKVLYLNLPSKRHFYEQISRVLSIRYLAIGPHLENVEFEHFLNLKHLQSLEIRFEKIGIRFVCKLFQQLKLLVHFNFLSTFNKFQIRILFGTCPIEFLNKSPVIGIRDFSHPYEFDYTTPTRPTGDFIKRRCKDVDELVSKIERMSKDKRIKNCIY